MDHQKPGVCLEGVEHARLLLRRDDDRLQRKLRTAWHDRLQLLQHALGVGHVGDDVIYPLTQRTWRFSPVL
jgi:hypothetical protein